MAKNSEPISYIKIGEVEHPIDAVTINGRTLPDSLDALPSVDSEDNGKILMVLQGQWTLYDSSNLYEEFNGIVVDGGSGPHDYSKDYLTLEVLDGGTIKWNAIGDNSAKTISYSLNDGNWTQITSTAAGVTLNVSAGDKIRLKGSNTSYATSNTVFSGFGGGEGVTGTATFDVSGNIMSLIYGDYFANQSTLSGTNNFQSLFDGSNVVSAENLILPSMTLTPHCYRALFANCAYLTTAPALPATTLAESCYRFMFSADYLLTSVPEILPATTLYTECYYGMFNACRALTTAPELPATTLVGNCYRQMFYGCTSLNYIKCLATNISATDCRLSWVNGVASSGTFVKADNMSSWTNGVDGIPTGWTVQDYNPYAEEYLTFDIKSDGNITWSALDNSNVKTISYSINNGTWTDITSSESGVTIPVTTGDKVRFKGSNSSYCQIDDSYYNSFNGTATFDVYGNIMSLIGGDNFSNLITLSSDYTFTDLFRECTGLISAENLILPAITLTNSCYYDMFSHCTGLTSIPRLPGITLADYCYSGMFYGCTSLITVQKLPAKTLDDYCYEYMFGGCTSLISAPELPATILMTGSYQYMFNGCTSLNYIKCLATDISATDCTSNWVNGVAFTGTFVKDPSMSSWTIDSVNGIPSGWTVEDDGVWLTNDIWDNTEEW